MSKRDIKRLLILNLPYLLLGLIATNFGEAWRLAEGADSSAKILGFFNTLPVALQNPLPSFYPLDLLVGIACGAGLRLAVYMKQSSKQPAETLCFQRKEKRCYRKAGKSLKSSRNQQKWKKIYLRC